MDSVSKNLIVIGAVLIIAGLIWHFSGGRIPLGRLPGDLLIKKENTRIYIPLMTSLLLSVVFSLIVYFFGKK